MVVIPTRSRQRSLQASPAPATADAVPDAASMQAVLAALRAIAEPTRLRILALCGQGEWCVSDLVEILGQSQPRLSRHLKLLCEAGVLDRYPEGANVQFRLSPRHPGLGLVEAALTQLAPDDSVLAADRRRAAARRADRARVASEAFRRLGADWDETAALGLDATAIEAALLALLPADGSLGRLLDIGSGTGRLLELLAPRIEAGTGVDLSREMLAIARARLAERGLTHCSVRHADMARLPFEDASFDLVTVQMVLHYADDVDAVLAEASRTLAPGGRLLLVDLARHGDRDLAQRHAHRSLGFEAQPLAERLARLGLELDEPVLVPGTLPVCLWSARAPGTPARRAPARSAVVSA